MPSTGGKIPCKRPQIPSPEYAATTAGKRKIGATCHIFCGVQHRGSAAGSQEWRSGPQVSSAKSECLPSTIGKVPARYGPSATYFGQGSCMLWNQARTLIALQVLGSDLLQSRVPSDQSSPPSQLKRPAPDPRSSFPPSLLHNRCNVRRPNPPPTSLLIIALALFTLLAFGSLLSIGSSSSINQSIKSNQTTIDFITHTPNPNSVTTAKHGS